MNHSRMPLPSVFSSKQNRVKCQKREPASPKKLQSFSQSTVNAPAHFCHNFCTKKMPCIYEENKHRDHSRGTRLPDIVPSLPNKVNAKETPSVVKLPQVTRKKKFLVASSQRKMS